jgi:quercetin dioxygenase-like cupin family protein
VSDDIGGRSDGVAKRPATGEHMTSAMGTMSGGHWNWAEVPAERIGEGIERQMIWGERLMVCRLQFAPRVVTAVHSHPHEQVTLVERGQVRFTVDGVERVATAGDVLFFPPNLPHGATMLDEPAVLVDIFSPVREDFLSGGGAYRKPER